MKVTWDPSAPPLKRLRTVYFLDSDGTERTANENDTASDDPSVFSSGSGHNLVEACEESAKHGNGIHWSSPRLRVRERLDVNKTCKLLIALRTFDSPKFYRSFGNCRIYGTGIRRLLFSQRMQVHYWRRQWLNDVRIFHAFLLAYTLICFCYVGVKLSKGILREIMASKCQIYRLLLRRQKRFRHSL